jgi:hypothetical protein
MAESGQKVEGTAGTLAQLRMLANKFDFIERQKSDGRSWKAGKWGLSYTRKLHKLH